MDIVSKSYEGNLYTNFDICFKNMMGDGQTADNGSGDSIHVGEGDCHGHAQVHGEQGAGVHAQGGEVMGEGEGGRGEEGQGGVVKHLVSLLEGESTF